MNRYRPSRTREYERIGESDCPENERMRLFPSAVLKRCSCLSAPVAAIYDIRSTPWLLLGFCHLSTDAVRIFEADGVGTIVGFDGATAYN